MQLNLQEKFFPEDKFITLPIMDYNALKQKWSNLDLRRFSLYLHISDIMTGAENIYIVLFFIEPDKVEIAMMLGEQDVTFHKNATVRVEIQANE